MLSRVTVPQVTSTVRKVEIAPTLLLNNREQGLWRSDKGQALALGSASAPLRNGLEAHQAMLASVGGNISVIQQSAGLMANAEYVQITGGHFVDVGGDMVNHYHFNGPSGAPPVPVIEAVLGMLPAANFRQKHLDTHAKWTDGTLLWVLEHRHFVEWYGSDGAGLLWGTGMRKCCFLF